MTSEKAALLLKSLMDGVDPITGEVLPADHVCCTPPVMRALHEAIMALSCGEIVSEPKPHQPEAPASPAAEDAPPMTKRGRLNAGRPWTEEDLEALKQMFQAGIAMEEICHALQRRERGVMNTLAYLGLVGTPAVEEKNGQRRVGKPWTKAEDDQLEKLYRQKKSVQDMAAALFRTPYGVFCHMEKLGLYGEEDGYPRYDSLPKMSKEDQDALRTMARRGESISDIAAALGRPENSIAARLFYMGLSKEAPVHLPGIAAIDE